MPALLLVAAACLAYANAWPNTLVYDDKPFFDYQRFTDFSAIPRYFTENAWAARGVSSDLYRPLLSVSLTLDAHLFGDWFAGWHLINILMHAAATLLLYAFLARLLALNLRFAVPGGAAGPYEPGSEGVLWWGTHVDRARGRGPASLLDRCSASGTCPKVIETFGSAEFWGLRMSPDLGLALQDGGVPAPDFAQHLDTAEWKKLTDLFLLD